MDKKVAAVVVTYNRVNLLVECLDALLHQTRPLEKIIIIDNASTDGTEKILGEKNLLNNSLIEYTRLQENTGSSGGFFWGVKRGVDEHYDWLWLMDDDAEPYRDALEKLMVYGTRNNIAALANLKVNSALKPLYEHRGRFYFRDLFKYRIVKPIEEHELNSEYLEIDHSSFVGVLLAKDAIKSVGLPNKDLFYQFDDLEYCLRLRKYGKILLVPQSIIVHKEADRKDGNKKSIIDKMENRISYDKLWLSYYQTRNVVFITARYAESKTNFLKWIISKYVRTLLAILLFDNHKIKRLNFTTQAYVDGLRGIFDNSKPRKILYQNVQR